MRYSAVALLVLLWSVTPVPGGKNEPAASREAGLIEAKVQGKLVRKGARYCVQAKNPGLEDAFLVELVRAEDKDRDLDEHISGLEGKVVVVRGMLRFSPGRADGPSLGIPIRDKAQVQDSITR